jgi:hypothetical protein
VTRDEQGFRRRTRPGWVRRGVSDIAAKRLKGLDEFTVPPFVGRMQRVRRRRKRAFHGALLIAVLVGVGLGLALF